MSSTETDKSAFPSQHYGEIGMTLRDYFAAKVLQGLLANPNVIQRDESGGFTLPTGCQEPDLIEFAFDLADLSLKER